MSFGGPYCASYAFLNATRVGDPDPRLFEVAMSTPFGLRHMSGDQFRFVASLVDPSLGLDLAAPLWGYRPTLLRAEDQMTLLTMLRDQGPGHRALVGPVNMGCLKYLDFAPLYLRYPHYIVVVCQQGGSWLIVDSENSIQLIKTDEGVARLLDVSSIPEARGNFNARVFTSLGKRPPKEEVLAVALERARFNYALAQAVDGGPSVFTRWGFALQGGNGTSHKLVALYDVSNLIIRRHLLVWMLVACRKVSLVENVDDVIHLVGQQVHQLSRVALSVRTGVVPDAGAFDELRRHELNISQAMEMVR